MSFICTTYFFLGFIALQSSIIVISALNPVHRIALLIVVFQAGSFMYIIQDYYFQGLTYIIVYVGAIAIQFLFVIMMIQIEPRNLSDRDDSQSLLILNADTLLVNGSATIDNLNDIHFTSPSEPSKFNIMNLVGLFQVQGLILTFAIFIVPEFTTNFYTTFIPNWSIDYKIMTDIQTQGNIIYIAYPLSLILIGVTQWIVMIGVIGITSIG